MDDTMHVHGMEWQPGVRRRRKEMKRFPGYLLTGLLVRVLFFFLLRVREEFVEFGGDGRS